MSDKNKRTVRRPGERPAPQAPLFDQQTAPIPRQPRRLPDTVVVQVAPATESWCAKTDAGWAILSDGLKVLKVQTDQPADLPVITGLGVNAPTAGRFLSLTTEAQSEQIADLMEQLYAQDLAGSCTRIDMGLGTDAYFVYDGRIKVLLGTFNNLDYKLSVAALLLKNESGEYLSSTDRGTLDVSSQLDDSVHRFTFAPGSFEQEESEPPPPDSAGSASGSTASGSEATSGAASGSASASQPSSDSVPASSAPASGSASQSASQPEE